MNKFRKIALKYNALPTPAKASLWFTICYILQRGIQFISMPIFTRIMSMEEYGVYSVFFSWFNIIVIFTSMNIHAGVINKAFIKYENERNKYITSIQWLTILITSIFGVCVIYYQELIMTWTGFNRNLIFLMLANLLMFPTLQYWLQEQRFFFLYKSMVIVTILNSLLSLVIGIILALNCENKAEGLVAATVGVQFFICVVIFVKNNLRAPTFFKKEFWSWTVLLAIPLIPHYVSEILLGHSARIIINNICGPAQAGIFSIVYMISMVMSIIRTGINGAFIPWTYRTLQNSKYKELEKVTNIIVIIMWILTLFFILIAPEILRIAAPSEYHEVIVDMPPIMISSFFIFIYVLFFNIEVYYERTVNVAIASAVAALVNIVLNYFFIPVFGYLVAGYVSMISYMFLMIMHYYFFCLIKKHNNFLHNVYNIKFIFAMAIALTVLGIGCLLIYDYLMVRYSLVICLICVVGFRGNAILNTIKNLKTE